MKARPSTFEERVARINKGKPRNAADVVVRRPAGRLIGAPYRRRWLHLDMILAGGAAGAVAGMLFAQNIGLLFLMSLDWTTLQGLLMSDYVLAGYVAACAIAPVGVLFCLIFSRSAKRAMQFWLCYLIGVLGANHVELRYVVEVVIIPGFWEYVGLYTSASDVVNDAAATQPQF